MATQSEKSDGKRRTPKAKLKWDFQMKQTLYILCEGFELQWAQRISIFTRIFQDQAQECGYSDGIPKSRLSAQYAERRKGQRDWVDIVAPAVSPDDQSRRDGVRTTIIEVARSLGILLPGQAQSQQQRAPLPPPSSSPSETEPTRPPVRSTPLSKRPADATWDPPESDDEYEKPQPKRRQTTRKVAGVEILRQTSTQTTTVMKGTAKLKTPRTGGKPKVPRTMIYHRPADAVRGSKPLMLSPQAYEETQQTLTPVAEHLAHPDLPPFLYRFWHCDNGPERHNMDNELKGFVARRFAHCPVKGMGEHIPNPPCYVDMLNHINREKDPSPWVSTSNSLWWILRLALKETDLPFKKTYRQDPIRTGRISVVDTSRLDPESVFHVRPYHAKLMKKRLFTDGAWNYGGCSEFVVYRAIPRDAIVRTFEVQEFKDWVERDPAAGRIFDLDLLKRPGKLKADIIPMFRQRGVRLGKEVAGVIAGMIQLLILGTEATSAQISHVTMDFIQGFGINLDKKDAEQWRDLARDFAKALLPRSDFRREMKAMGGFLDGVRYGSSKKFNTKHEPELVRRMQKQAQSIGLGNVYEILFGELEGIGEMLLSQEQRKDKLLNWVPGQPRVEPRPAVGREETQTSRLGAFAYQGTPKLRQSNKAIVIDDADESDDPDFDDRDELQEEDGTYEGGSRRSGKQAMILESDGLDSGYDEDNEIFSSGTNGLVAG